MTTMKSKRTIAKELARVEKIIRGKQDPNTFGPALMGAQQALAWALGRNAMAPAKCYGPLVKSSESGKKL